MTPAQLDALARAAGAMVLGDEGTRQQYLIDLDQLVALVRLATLPPCPVSLPPSLEKEQI